MDPRRLKRPLRFLLIGASLLVLAMFLRSRDRPQTISMGERDSSLAPVFPPGSVLLVRLIEPEDPLALDENVMYQRTVGERRNRYFGRVRGLSGDTIGARDGYLTRNDQWIGPPRLRGAALGVVPPGHVCVLVVTPSPNHNGDSRRFGFIPRADVRAVIESRMK